MTREQSRVLLSEVERFSQQIGRDVVESRSNLDTIVAKEFSRTFPDLGSVTPDKELPPGWSRLYFREFGKLDELRTDGSPQAAGSEVLTSLPTRVFGAIEFDFIRPLRSGIGALRRTMLESVDTKMSRSGPLVIAVDRSEIYQEDRLCEIVRETSIYKGVGRAPHEAPHVAREGVKRQFTVVELFRYAAVTRNSHRLHYDYSWARDVEGFEDLVVPGPLLVLWMLSQARVVGPMTKASFRFFAPALAHRELTISTADHSPATELTLTEAGSRVMIGQITS